MEDTRTVNTTHLNDLHESPPYTQAERHMANAGCTGYPAQKEN